VLALIELLLKANSGLINHVDGEGDNILHKACMYLPDDLGVAVISFLLAKNKEEVGACLRTTNQFGELPIHYAAGYSTLNVVELLLKEYPESLYETDSDGNNLLHFALYNLLHFALLESRLDRTLVNDMVSFLCDKNAAFLPMSNNDGYIPLSYYLHNHIPLDLNTIILMCEKNENIVTQPCQSSDISYQGMLPLHFLLVHQNFDSTVSIIADCFRYLLHLYPAAATIKNRIDESPYNLAVMLKIDDYYVRLLLNADLTIDSERRLALNYEAQKQAIFLAFRAVTTNKEPSIWIKLRDESRDLLMHAISYL
jgi:ankyrin repeat protein